MSFRDITGYAQEPIQQSMQSPPEDNTHLHYLHFELGIVLNVQLADSSNNFFFTQ